MAKAGQAAKAERFRALHHDPKLLVLPNIWDPFGARLLVAQGYPAVATASSAIAWSLGYDDGQLITFEMMLDVIRRIADSVDVPVTADIERGYAESPDDVAENVLRVIDAGAVGINFEDGKYEGGPLCDIELQCRRIRAMRAVADVERLPLVINARIDVYLGGFDGSASDKLAETIKRGQAYIDAGADCLFPIMLTDGDSLAKLREETGAFINVYATADTPPMQELEKIGISRLSLGTGLFKAGATAMRAVARELMGYGPYDRFTSDAMQSREIIEFISKDRMA
jgi:2-methylisocitrate lyase-like PEP mutase family enzyme